MNFEDIKVSDLKTRKALPPPSGFAVLYARFSPRPGEKDCPSSGNQLESLAKHCGENGLTVRAEFHDDAVSGSTLDRDGLHEAINALQPGDVLLVTMSDRLTRGGAVDMAAIEYLVNQAGAVIQYTQEANSDGSPNAELLRDLMAAVAKHFNAILKIRSMEGRKAKAQKGGFVGGSVPFGYQLEPTGEKTARDKPAYRLVPDEDEQETIRMIQDFRKGGADWGEVVRMLNRRERKTKSGRPWNLRQLRWIVDNRKDTIYDLPQLDITPES